VGIAARHRQRAGGGGRRPFRDASDVARACVGTTQRCRVRIFPAELSFRQTFLPYHAVSPAALRRMRRSADSYRSITSVIPVGRAHARVGRRRSLPLTRVGPAQHGHVPRLMHVSGAIWLPLTALTRLPPCVRSRPCQATYCTLPLCGAPPRCSSAGPLTNHADVPFRRRRCLKIITCCNQEGRNSDYKRRRYVASARRQRNSCCRSHSGRRAPAPLAALWKGMHWCAVAAPDYACVAHVRKCAGMPEAVCVSNRTVHADYQVYARLGSLV
jgi:hypothetical protein